MKKNVLIALLIILIMIFTFKIVTMPNLRDFSSLKNTTAKKLMIVAHPDDEVLWGLSELVNDKYFVVCITCGSRYDRVKEFERVMKYLNTDYIMLDYPDKVNGERSDWKSEYSSITNDLKRIITYKKWDKVVTHNKEGEYGHIHHKMTNKIVTGISTDNLYYFGKYYRKPKNLNKMFRFASILSKNIPFVRVDFYEVNGKLYFGELTFYPSAGFDDTRTIECQNYLDNKLKIKKGKF